MTKWKYSLEVREGVRLYRNVEGKPNGEREGRVWELIRTCKQEDGQTNSESVVVSAEVFNGDEAAKRDALRKLSIRRCPLEKPIDHVIRLMLDD